MSNAEQAWQYQQLEPTSKPAKLGGGMGGKLHMTVVIPKEGEYAPEDIERMERDYFEKQKSTK